MSDAQIVTPAVPAETPAAATTAAAPADGGSTTVLDPAGLATLMRGGPEKDDSPFWNKADPRHEETKGKVQAHYAALSAGYEERANAELFGPPARAAEYDLRLRAAEPFTDLAELETEFKNTLHAEGVPNSLVRLARQITDRNGALSEAALEESRQRGWRELTKRHGEAKAAEILSEAKALYDRLDERSPELVDLLEATGVANDWNFIESSARVRRLKGR